MFYCSLKFYFTQPACYLADRRGICGRRVVWLTGVLFWRPQQPHQTPTKPPPIIPHDPTRRPRQTHPHLIHQHHPKHLRRLLRRAKRRRPQTRLRKRQSMAFHHRRHHIRTNSSRRRMDRRATFAGHGVAKSAATDSASATASNPPIRANFAILMRVVLMICEGECL